MKHKKPVAKRAKAKPFARKTVSYVTPTPPKKAVEKPTEKAVEPRYEPPEIQADPGETPSVKAAREAEEAKKAQALSEAAAKADAAAARANEHATFKSREQQAYTLEARIARLEAQMAHILAWSTGPTWVPYRGMPADANAYNPATLSDEQRGWPRPNR